MSRAIVQCQSIIVRVQYTIRTAFCLETTLFSHCHLYNPMPTRAVLLCNSVGDTRDDKLACLDRKVPVFPQVNVVAWDQQMLLLAI